eukprot:CAMPEP_0174698624 /NCGR_PEP_ID=MMETSP1094-20130205/4160_1 /TAXON_ID=156173 /ORGANISM="Chrysochromulina brevifilum, Strain UTEX LB 985" /LENGTH=85 /DNA_ID=CAMNT_0015895829 /DNA_START=358 /DNA_END=615 /DNA_ORIENTATION=+
MNLPASPSTSASHTPHRSMGGIEDGRASAAVLAVSSRSLAKAEGLKWCKKGAAHSSSTESRSAGASCSIEAIIAMAEGGTHSGTV